MTRLTRVHKECRCACACQSGRYLIADMPRFSHTRDHDASFTGQYHFAGIMELVVDAFD